MLGSIFNYTYYLPRRGTIEIWRCLSVSKKEKNKQREVVSDKHAVREKLSTEFDHEFANEPLTAEERHNNKKTKKRQ